MPNPFEVAELESRSAREITVALVATGAEAIRLETSLETADRQATAREVDTAALIVQQLRELVEAVASRVPPGTGQIDR